MAWEGMPSPAALLAGWRPDSGAGPDLAAHDRWWLDEGRALSETVDRAGTPALIAHDRLGRPVDRIAFPAEYRRLLLRGYAEGVVARAFDEDSLLPGYCIGYVTSFHDAGLYCPYTVSLATAVAVHKYAPDALRDAVLPRLTRRNEGVWQGATWMTEAGGGSDLGANVATCARRDGERWRLEGDKYFASNAGAETAIVAARPEGAAAGVRGLALFLLLREDDDGALNYRIRRLKDKIATRSVPTGEIALGGSEAWLLGAADTGIYLIMEALNVSRVANSIAAAALLQRALAEAVRFASERRAFGRAVVDQPLFRRQTDAWWTSLRECFALAWAAADELDVVWRERPPYSERYHRFRLLAHLAKLHTAEQAVQCAKWSMEAHGGNGAVADFGVERLLREAMILSIWEGTPHRQMLDGLEVMQRQQAHEGLIEWLGEPAGADTQRAAIARLLEQDAERAQGDLEPVFREFAAWTARALGERLPDFPDVQ